MKRLLLLGGGHAHLQVLHAFAREPLASARVTLVTPHAHLTYSGMLPGLVAGHYEPAQCLVPLRAAAEAARTHWVEGRAARIDAAARRVHLADGTALDYDVLSLDTGATMDRDAIPGAREHGLFVRPIEAFTLLWERCRALASERALSVVVVGAGAAGVELAMAIAHGLGERARVGLVTGGTAPVPAHPVGVQRRVRRALKRRQVTVFEDECVEVDARQAVLRGGARLACDMPVIAIGASAPDLLRGSGLALDAQGFVATGATLQSPSHPEVFAAGDVASRIDEPRPRSGVYALRAGAPLALNLRRFVAGGALEPYRAQRRALNLLACGDRYAIASWGGWSAEGRWVWRWKDRLDRGFVARHGGEA